jgi:hypothetical protein
MQTLKEPPSYTSSLVIIGRNSRGNWVAQEQNGLFGGLFVDRAHAVKYALFENGHRREAIVLTANIIELDLHRKVLPSPASVNRVDVVCKVA